MRLKKIPHTPRSLIDNTINRGATAVTSPPSSPRNAVIKTKIVVVWRIQNTVPVRMNA